MQITYEVWAVGKKRDWLKYEGTSEVEALAAKAKAERTGKWAEVKLDCRVHIERTPEEVREWMRTWRG